MKYIPTLGGFRGLCVIAVILRHWGAFKLGWVGVQGFFVLSGFLITAILLDSKSRTGDRPAQFFSVFYWRRTTRIFPLYYTFLAATAALFLLTGYPTRFGSEKPFFSSEGLFLAGSMGFIVGLVLSFALTMAVAEISFWTLESWFLRRKGLIDAWWARTPPGLDREGPATECSVSATPMAVQSFLEATG